MIDAEAVLWAIGWFVVGFGVAAAIVAKTSMAIERDAVETGVLTHKKKAYRVIPFERN